MQWTDNVEPWLQLGGAGVIAALAAYAVRMLTSVVSVRDAAATKEVEGWKAIAESERERATSAEVRAATLLVQLLEERAKNGGGHDD